MNIDIAKQNKLFTSVPFDLMICQMSQADILPLYEWCHCSLMKMYDWLADFEGFSSMTVRDHVPITNREKPKSPQIL